MGRFRTLLALALVLALVSSSYAAKGKGKKHSRPVRGTISKVSTDSLVVKVPEGEKKDHKTTDQTFTLGTDTKYEFMTVTRQAKGEKPKIETKTAALSDLKTGDRVRVSKGEGTAAQKVSIIQFVGSRKKSS
jgi:sRNA-binding protein